MPRDDLTKRIEALNRKPLTNVPKTEAEASPDIEGLRRKLAKRTASGQKASRSISQPVAGAASGQKASRSISGDASSMPPFALPDAAVKPERIVYARGVPVNARPAGPRAVRDLGPPVALEEAVEGIAVAAGAGPGYYLVEQPAIALEAQAVYLHRRFVSLTGHPQAEAVERLAEIRGAGRIAPEEVLFLDLETTGLGMTPVFLVGTMECTSEGFHFRQYFARDYSEEAGIVAAISERLADVGMIVTFNGKSFDMPFLCNRAVATGVKLAHPASHLDLLHEARRKYKRDLPNCRLQTLEQMICGRERDDDIPGAEIPEAYHEFVRTGNAAAIALILQHNLYDLLTMADLMHRMWG